MPEAEYNSDALVARGFRVGRGQLALHGVVSAALLAGVAWGWLLPEASESALELADSAPIQRVSLRNILSGQERSIDDELLVKRNQRTQSSIRDHLNGLEALRIERELVGLEPEFELKVNRQKVWHISFEQAGRSRWLWREGSERYVLVSAAWFEELWQAMDTVPPEAPVRKSSEAESSASEVRDGNEWGLVCSGHEIFLEGAEVERGRVKLWKERIRKSIAAKSRVERSSRAGNVVCELIADGERWKVESDGDRLWLQEDSFRAVLPSEFAAQKLWRLPHWFFRRSLCSEEPSNLSEIKISPRGSQSFSLLRGETLGDWRRLPEKRRLGHKAQSELQKRISELSALEVEAWVPAGEEEKTLSIELSYDDALAEKLSRYQFDLGASLPSNNDSGAACWIRNKEGLQGKLEPILCQLLLDWNF